MPILVCPLSKVGELIALHQPSCVISLADPGHGTPDAGRRLQLFFHDVHAPAENHVAPSVDHVRELLHFLKAWNPGDTLLIHCRAGIGRSTAVAYVAACLTRPDVHEQAIAGATECKTQAVPRDWTTRRPPPARAMS